MELAFWVFLGTGVVGFVCLETLALYKEKGLDQASIAWRERSLKFILIVMLLSVPITIAAQHIEIKTDVVPTQEKVK